jgi:hypothetical protein
MRIKKPFVVFKRALPSGKSSYSYYAYREDGTRTSPRSTGQRTKAAAERYCNELYRKGELIPKTLISFKEYTEDWWVYEKCAYVQRKLRTRNRFSPSHAASQRVCLVRYIKPTFDVMDLADIKTGDIEKWRASLVDVHHLSQLTANHVLATLMVILREATRRQDWTSPDSFQNDYYWTVVVP